MLEKIYCKQDLISFMQVLSDDGIEKLATEIRQKIGELEKENQRLENLQANNDK